VPKFPEPPPAAELATVAPDVRVVPQGTVLWRIYFADGPHPVSWNTFRYFGPTNSRFDHHLLPKAVQDRGILYAAEDGMTTFAEVFQETRTIDRRRNSPYLVSFELAQPIGLLDLGGNWPTQAGASMAINAGPRPRARRWAQRIYEVYPGVQGLWYASSMHGNKPAVALFERGLAAMPVRPTFHRALADSALDAIVTRAAGRFRYDLVG
jgi:hypothetical protein